MARMEISDDCALKLADLYGLRTTEDETLLEFLARLDKRVTLLKFGEWREADLTAKATTTSVADDAAQDLIDGLGL